MDVTKKRVASAKIRIAVDIGSTVVKIACIGPNGELLTQDFLPRDFESGIAWQVESMLDQIDVSYKEDDVLLCSSANGGLRVGIVSLTEHFSGRVLRNQVLSAGANPIFTSYLDDDLVNLNDIDILLVGGGIDCTDAGLLEEKIKRFKPEQCHFNTLIYAGNRYLAELFKKHFQQAVIIPNPLGETLVNGPSSVFEALRLAYLNDLVYKKGVTELRNDLSAKIRPTPEVVNRGFQRIVSNRSSIKVAGSCLLFDIGGATTDLHYTVEILREDSDNRPSKGSSTARYVFTDLGIVGSCDSTLLQMRNHPRIYEFLSLVVKDGTRDAYQLLREGEYKPSPEQLSYACLFLGLERFASGRGPGLPVADLGKVAHIILTGGAAQGLDVDLLTQLVKLFFSDEGSLPVIYIDKRYQVWIDGITE